MKVQNKIYKNCGNCWWSNRDIKNLKLECTLTRTIENAWDTAKNCKEYAYVGKRKPNKQLTVNFE